jgi:hypothetical protein
VKEKDCNRLFFPVKSLTDTHRTQVHHKSAKKIVSGKKTESEIFDECSNLIRQPGMPSEPRRDNAKAKLS